MTPDMQEGGPVTRVVTTHFFQDGSDSWSADIIREALGLPGSVDVIGPGPASQALVFAARACMEDGGTFQPDGPGFERAMPQGTNIGFRFPGACL